MASPVPTNVIDPGTRFARCAALINLSRITTGWHRVNYPYCQPRTYPSANDENGTPLSPEREQAFVERMKRPVLLSELSETRVHLEEEQDDPHFVDDVADADSEDEADEIDLNEEDDAENVVEAKAEAPAVSGGVIVGGDMADRHRKAAKVRNRREVENAYRALLDTNEQDGFYRAVIKFAKGKITTGLWNLPETSSTVDDHAQQVAFNVSQNLHKFKGEPSDFYSWLNKFCYNQKMDACNEANGESAIKAPLFVEFEEGEFEPNPDLYPTELPTEYQRRLPEFIQGLDLKICEYIREGYDYEKVGQVLDLTETAVKLRVFKMRTKIQEMKNAKS
jgi:DNA-directed RNA polymerase specialized sigma24 family protein